MNNRNEVTAVRTKKEITEEAILKEANATAVSMDELDQNNPVRISQQKIVLKQEGRKYSVQPLSNRVKLEAFCARLNKDECYEKFSVIAVNCRCVPIGVYSITGSLQEVSPYPRIVATYALLSNAHSVFFTHNHPGGTCAPSYEDISSTVKLQKVLDSLGITVLDHIITTPEGNAYSMKAHGDF